MMNEFSFELIRDVAPQPIVLEPLHTEENGVFAPPAGVNGFSSVEVAVPIPPAPVLTTLSVSENGTYTPEQGVDGFNEVSVNIPDPHLYMEGDISDAFRNGQVWGYLKNRLTLGEITRMDTAWSDNYNLEDGLPDLTLADSCLTVENPFFQTNLKHLPRLTVKNSQGYVLATNFSANYSQQLLDFRVYGKVVPNSTFKWSNQFYECNRLRYIEPAFLGAITTAPRDSYGGFQNCYSLDEIHNYPAISSYQSFIRGSYRLKSFTFLPNASLDVGDKTVYIINVGYVENRSTFLQKTDFTTDTEITDAASYAALKANADCWSANIAYSRYDRASAAETLTSLPTNTGSGNPVIVFIGNMGSATDEGAINTLLPEEIAVAAVKGWTVSYQ